MGHTFQDIIPPRTPFNVIVFFESDCVRVGDAGFRFGCGWYTHWNGGL